MNGTRIPVLERFETHFARGGDDDCWEWSGDATGDGHGRFSLSSTRGERKRIIASQLALLLTGDYPEDKALLACHTCDNPPCVNPAHLYWGTDGDNVRDAVVRQRRADMSGPRKRMSVDQRTEIKARHSAGQTIASIAEHYGINRLTVRRIVTNAPQRPRSAK